MFSLFKSKKSQADLPTFKQRVTMFWDWYRAQAPRFATFIDADNAQQLAEEVSGKIDEFLPGFVWEFGPGRSFTLSGEGAPDLQLLAAAWRQRAPEVEGWAFHAARQPRSLGLLQIGDASMDIGAIRVAPTVDEELEKVHIDVSLSSFLPLSPRSDEQLHAALFLGLDSALGELGTAQWIGGIEFGEPEGETIPLSGLAEMIAELQEQSGWEKAGPGEAWTMYKLPDPSTRFPRADIVVGQTTHTRLIEDYLESEGNFKDPVEPFGADFAYLSFDSSVLPRGEESAARGAIEDALEAALRPDHLGQLLGGAFGRERSYVDLLLLDGARSVDAVAQAVKDHGVAGRPALEYFAKAKRGERMVI